MQAMRCGGRDCSAGSDAVTPDAEQDVNEEEYA